LRRSLSFIEMLHGLFAAPYRNCARRCVAFRLAKLEH
jgi:hypothetical protein